MYILSAVKLRRAAGSDAVGSQGLNGLFFDLFVAHEVVEVVGGEVYDSSAVGKFDSRTSWTNATLAELFYKGNPHTQQ